MAGVTFRGDVEQTKAKRFRIELTEDEWRAMGMMRPQKENRFQIKLTEDEWRAVMSMRRQGEFAFLSGMLERIIDEALADFLLEDPQ